EAAVAEDLVAFHRAGEMAIAGEAAAAYDPAQFRAALADHQKGLLWLNPPHAFLIMAPIAMLPYGVAKLAWVALGALSMLSIMMIAKLRAPALFVLALASPAMLISTLLLQFGPFIAIGLAAGLTLAPKRPLIAGIVLALLTMKPQYGLMAPVFFAATGQWRVIISAAISTIVLVAASAAIFGVESWDAFFHSLSSVHTPFARQTLEGTVAFSQTAAKFGGGDAARIASQAAGVLMCGAVVWIAARRLVRADAIALTLLASLAAAPSAWIYDWPIAAAGIAFMAARPNWPVPVQIAAALAWMAPLAPVFAENGFSRLASPLALDAFLAAASVWLLRAKD
ncbi:MAG: glycosyltransferase family 87 protein, partial [Pseudomonadota bacterium]